MMLIDFLHCPFLCLIVFLLLLLLLLLFLFLFLSPFPFLSPFSFVFSPLAKNPRSSLLFGGIAQDELEIRLFICLLRLLDYHSSYPQAPPITYAQVPCYVQIPCIQSWTGSYELEPEKRGSFSNTEAIFGGLIGQWNYTG